MANYCDNEIEITGNEEDIEAFRKDLKKKGEPFLASFWPMPSELENTVSPPGNAVGPDRPPANIEKIHEAKEKGKTIPEPIEAKNSTVEKQIELLEKYGACDWHNWKQNEWGTKWIRDFEIMEERKSLLKYKVTSANSPPYNLIQNIANIYNKLRFSLTYSIYEEHGDVAKTVEIYGGRPITNELLDPPGTVRIVKISGPDHGSGYGGEIAECVKEKDGNIIFTYLENHRHAIYGNEWQTKDFKLREHLVLSPGKFGYSPAGEILDITILK